MHRTYHTPGRPIALSENGVGKHIGKDWRRNEDARVFYPPSPSSFAPQHPKRSSENPTAVFVVPTPRAHSHHNTQTKQREFHRCLCHSHTPSLFAPQHSDEDGDNPTAVFIVPIYSCKPVTLAVQSSGFPPLFCCTHSLQRLRLRPTRCGVIPSALITAHTLYLHYPTATILQLVQDATTASSVHKSIDIFRLIHSFALNYKIKCD